MHKLGEQWIEVIDGQEHMFKAVTPIVNGHTDIKDLGILKDGRLSCPFCGDYPKIVKYGMDYKNNHGLYQISHRCAVIKLGMTGFRNEQQAIDAWNRRV